ncbi:MAG: hypothetical protein ACI8UX_001694, partial [Psychromonas sp.]
PGAFQSTNPKPKANNMKNMDRGNTNFLFSEKPKNKVKSPEIESEMIEYIFL